MFREFPVSGLPIPPGSYDFNELTYSYTSDRSAPFSAGVRATTAGFYDGHIVTIRPTINARYGETLNLSLRYSRNDIDLPSGSTITNLTSVSAGYNFSPRLYVQTLVQHNDSDDLFSVHFRVAGCRMPIPVCSSCTTGPAVSTGSCRRAQDAASSSSTATCSTCSTSVRGTSHPQTSLPATRFPQSHTTPASTDIARPQCKTARDESQLDHVDPRVESHAAEGGVHAFYRSRITIHPCTTLRIVGFTEEQQRRFGILHGQTHAPIGAVGFMHGDGALDRTA